MDLTYPNIRANSSFHRQPQQQQYQYAQPPQPAGPPGPPYGRPPPPIPSNSPTRVGIKVTLKPEYRLTPSPQLLPLLDDIPSNSFHFDFELERRILEEAKNSSSTWNASPPVIVEDPVVLKYTSTGLNKEAVVLALATYGDIQTKVIEFVSSYKVLREMGFEPEKIAGALAMYDNDKERASAHLLG